MSRTRQIDIQRALALAGLFTFLCSCAKGCLLPFLTLYFRQLGLSPAMTGMVMGASHLVSLVWSPLASLLSKHYNKRRVVIGGSLVCSAAVVLVLLLFPPSGENMHFSSCSLSNHSSRPTGGPGDKLLITSKEPETSLSSPGVTVATETTAEEKSSLGNTSTSPHTRTGSAEVNETSRPAAEPSTSSSAGSHNTSSESPAAVARRKRSYLETRQQEDRMPEEVRRFEFLGYLKVMDPQHQLFFLILITVVAWESVWAPLEWTADDGLYDYLDFADASDRYSSTTLWSLLGTAFGAAGVGLLVSQLNCTLPGETPRSAVHFYCYCSVAVLAAPAAVYLPLYLNKKRERANGLLKAMQLVRGSPRALLCAVTTLMVGAAVAAVENFLLWQMQDHGATELHMGLAVAVALFSQTTFPLVADRVSRLLSSGRVLAGGAAVLSLQCLYYSVLWGPWSALPAQTVTCFSSGALWWAVDVQCEDVATPEAQRHVRRVYSALTLHLGGGLGSVAAGFVAERFGVAWMFRGVAVALTVWCVCLLLLQWKTPRQRRINYSRLLVANVSEASDSESEQERDWLDKAMQEPRGKNHCGRKLNY